MTDKPAKGFATVATKDSLHLFPDGEMNIRKIVELLRFKNRDVAQATELPINAIRYDDRIPRELADALRQWANLLNLVGDYFEGDVEKTCLWFTLPNPELGEMTPRDMIRVGRYKKLLRFVLNSLQDN